MKHKSKVEKYDGGLESLAHNIGNLRYDALAQFLESLAIDFKRQSVSDGGKGRKQLSSAMLEAAKSVEQAKFSVEKAWKISEPYMEE